MMDARFNQNSSQFAIVLLLSLLALDLVLIWFHVQWGEYPVWNVEYDGGYAERFQYLKWAAAVVLLLILAWKRLAAIYAVWAGIFFYLLLDDSLSLHERVGGWLVAPLRLQSVAEIYRRHFEFFYLRERDFGELTVALVVGMAIAVALYCCWPAREARRERSVTKWLIAWMFLFAFFAVGIDMIHIMASEIYPPAMELLGLIEDGGEMICASLLVGGLALELTRDREL